MFQPLPIASFALPPLGESAAIGAAIGWAGTAMFFTAGGRRVGSLAVNIIRLAMALVLMTILRTILFGQPLPVDATGHAWAWLIVSGVVGMAICDLCLFEAFLWVGPRVGMLLLTLSPIVTAALGWLVLGEGMTGLNIGGMAMVLGGVAWVVLERRRGPDGQTHSHPIGGILLGVVAAVTQGVGTVLSKIGMETIEKQQDAAVRFRGYTEATQIRVMTGLVAIAIFYCFIRAWPKVGRALKDRRGMAFTSCGAFIGPFLGVTLSMIAINEASGLGIASTLMMTGPVFILPLTAIFFKERITYRAVVGAGLAVAGVFVLLLKPGQPAYDWLMNAYDWLISGGQ